ncbi:hypothetical protein IVB45_04395 [Bradyrhizobium sp. 4]|uniref:hypothetical protein n=1 Tax=unclassified Bradyrhizobium TaxID=2631580 RepID=UPI001FF8791A|nr:MULTISPECIES: hypothetical protein [unclassified Bradyrhizobium]MCK1400505.1 hypothetical protein [Bradyrhizobium sp. 39]MCK1749418.1 hypothetical protein [Bradyrhizobium sp. 135]UPJ36247.1 hypothetical protein IVB45_04395 [Bradyrhizobium sp. 4]
MNQRTAVVIALPGALVIAILSAFEHELIKRTFERTVPNCLERNTNTFLAGMARQLLLAFQKRLWGCLLEGFGLRRELEK